MDGFLIKLAEIRTALNTGLYNCALAVSLTLPDICGKIEFPMRVDLENRPYQIYDEEFGRMATTEWKLMEEFSLEESFLQGEHEQDSIWRTRVEFMPITGRTHQLRLHSAHEKGLGLAIVGDRLYGKIFSDERLCLQAFYLKFTHPTTEQIMEFSVPFEF